MTPEWVELLSRSSLTGSWSWIVLKASSILIVAEFLARYWPRTSAAGRHLIWLTSLCAVLTLPVARMLVPEIRLPVLPAGAGSSPAEQWEPNQGETATPPPFPREGDPERNSAELMQGRINQATSAGSRPWSFWLLCTYLLGAVLLSGFLGVGLLRLHCLTRDSERDDCGAEAAGRLSALLGIRRSLSVRVSKRVKLPFAWGCWHPVVMLPAEFRRWSRRRQSDVLAHELAHVDRLDWVSLLLGRIVCILYWPLPFAWWGFWRMAGEAERACDDQVLLLGSVPADYARQLLEFATNHRGSSAPASGLLGTPEISLRIQAILNPDLRRTSMKKTLYCSAVISGLMMALAAGAVRLEERVQPGRPAELLRAATNGDLSKVRRLIQSGINPSALMEAASRGNLEAISLLIEYGADPNRPHPGDGNALIAAARAHQFEAVRRLLDLGARPDAAVPGDGSALIAAAAEGNTDIVGLLLERGADANASVQGDENPLINAARGGHLAAARLLIEAGARVNTEIRDNGRIYTALGEAYRMGHDAMVDLLLRYRIGR